MDSSGETASGLGVVRLDVPPVTKTDILPYLTSPVGTQLSLESVPA
ncbi:MAG: hypothetical protein OXG91_13980 [bacterium]|nr:hypothetical protein [bacterium]